MLNKFIKVGMVCLASFLWMSLAFSSGSHAHNHVSGVENKSVGKPSQESKARKRIKVVTSDNMRFTFPKNLTLKEGEIITFVVTNDGKIPHEFSIGNWTLAIFKV